jgi:glycosyltransferase involved in cell wall biosynthesis
MKSLCNELVAQSRNAALWISSQVGTPFLVINNSINLQHFRREKLAISDVPRTKVLFVGRLVEGKGLSQCIQAVQKANEVLAETAIFPPFSLTIVGSGPLGKQFNETSFDFEVSYLGEMSHSQVIEQMFHSDILIQAYSQPEGMTTVTLEGLAAGLIIVTTPLGGNNHFKDCQNFLSDEIQYLPDLLLRAREIRASRESFIIQGLQIIESEFTWNLTAERILKKRFFDYQNFN